MMMMMMMMKVMTMIMIMNVADWALNLLLSVPARIIRQAHPLATHVTYMDDRSFAASSVSEVKSIWNLWTAHSADLCLKESKAKTQITCRQNAKRMMAALDDVVGPYIKDTIEVLGCNFSPGHSKPSPKEFTRFEIATISLAVLAWHLSRLTPGCLWLVLQPLLRHHMAGCFVHLQRLFLTS